MQFYKTVRWTQTGWEDRDSRFTLIFKHFFVHKTKNWVKGLHFS